MRPLELFDAAWQRGEHLNALYAYLQVNTASIMQIDELLRAIWSSSVSTFDLYIHELTAQEMTATFAGVRPATAAYAKFELPMDATHTIAMIGTASAIRVFEREVRAKLGRQTFQHPD